MLWSYLIKLKLCTIVDYELLFCLFLVAYFKGDN